MGIGVCALQEHRRLLRRRGRGRGRAPRSACGAWSSPSTSARRSTPTASPTRSRAARSRPTSWTLKEAVRFDRARVTSDAWESYPILRFSEVPEVEVEIIARPDEQPLGAGEAAHGPTAAAIANAVLDALGVRVRDLPHHARAHPRRDGRRAMTHGSDPERRRGAGARRGARARLRGRDRLQDRRRVRRGRRHGARSCAPARRRTS